MATEAIKMAGMSSVDGTSEAVPVYEGADKKTESPADVFIPPLLPLAGRVNDPDPRRDVSPRCQVVSTNIRLKILSIPIATLGALLSYESFLYHPQSPEEEVNRKIWFCYGLLFTGMVPILTMGFNYLMLRQDPAFADVTNLNLKQQILYYHDNCLGGGDGPKKRREVSKAFKAEPVLVRNPVRNFAESSSEAATSTLTIGSATTTLTLGTLVYLALPELRFAPVANSFVITNIQPANTPEMF